MQYRTGRAIALKQMGRHLASRAAYQYASAPRLAGFQTIQQARQLSYRRLPSRLNRRAAERHYCLHRLGFPTKTSGTCQAALCRCAACRASICSRPAIGIRAHASEITCWDRPQSARHDRNVTPHRDSRPDRLNATVEARNYRHHALTRLDDSTHERLRLCWLPSRSARPKEGGFTAQMTLDAPRAYHEMPRPFATKLA